LELSEDYKTKFLPKYFKVMTKRIKDNKDSDFIVGNTFTIADAHCA